MTNHEMDFLKDLDTTRQRANRLLNIALSNKSSHFSVNLDAMDKLADFVIDVMKRNYPDLNIPYHSRWRHFNANNYDRVNLLKKMIFPLPKIEQGKILFELVIISVLMDAGAGDQWSYIDSLSAQSYQRSEGLALAVFNAYINGLFSEDVNQPLRVDANKLTYFNEENLSLLFQLENNNPLKGTEGRLQMIRRLGSSLGIKKDYFGENARLGELYPWFISHSKGSEIDVVFLFKHTLDALEDIWPRKGSNDDLPLGDVWQHSALKTHKPYSEWIPFHKLSQWLTYSLIEPLEWTGFKVKNINYLTGLPEYRNGGLFIDMGVLIPKDKSFLSKPIIASSELIVEWRGLTVALLDSLAEMIRSKLDLTENELPLAKILQGGTWYAGREIAKINRDSNEPPIRLISDGTVF